MEKDKLSMLSRLHGHRPTILLLCVVVSLVLVMVKVLGHTYSWFTNAEQADNVFRTPDFLFSFQVEEEFDPPGSVAPGQNVEKVVHVRNIGDEAGLIRVLVLVEIFSEDGVVLQATPGATFTFIGLNTTDHSLGNTNMWADGGDGYYYYLGKLESGKITEQPLFSGIQLSAGLGTEYVGADMKIEIKVEASETSREKYRDGWWKNGDNAPTALDLIPIDDALKNLAK